MSKVYVSSGVGPKAAPAGDDKTGDGSLEKPFRTITHALKMGARDIVVRQGRYNEGYIDARNATIRGYPGDIEGTH